MRIRIFTLVKSFTVGLTVTTCVLALAEDIAAPIQFNEAEAIIEPFFSTELSGLRKWMIESGEAHGVRVWQNWAAVDFEWTSKPEEGPALRMERAFNLDCSAYDRLIVRIVPPKSSIVRVVVETEKGGVSFQSEPMTSDYVELPVDLNGATIIRKISLEVFAHAEGPGAGWLQWIGLQSTERLPLYFQRWDFSRMDWSKHIKDESYTPEFKPRYGILMTQEELDALREEHAKSMAATGTSFYLESVKHIRSIKPEIGIHEFAQSGGRVDVHARERDKDQPILDGNPQYAAAALVVKDAEALRMTARYALCEAMSEHWDTGFMSVLPGSPWEDRAFRRSYTTQDMARVLDLAGEIFTETGRLYMMRRLAEEGVGKLNFVAWRHEYIFHCNQLAYFNKARMFAYLVLEQEWPRVKPYADLAYQDTVNNLELSIEPDGGSLEGPSYFCPTVRENYEVMKHYARARGLDLPTITPDVVKHSADFGAAVASTTKEDVIPICDADSDYGLSMLETLVELTPNSYWVTMYNKRAAIEGKPPLAQDAPPLPHFVALPDTGHIASLRSLGDEQVKVLIVGNKNGAEHTHEDKGSFVLEFAGETFAMDLGICDYSDPLSNAYKQCQRHNMLAPVGMPERAHPDNPLRIDVKSTGQGDAQAFHAQIDATPGWNGYYKKWVRTWDSPSPDTLTIRDEYELEKGDGVEFYWQTMLPCEQKGHSVVIKGTRGTVTLTSPEDSEIRIEQLPLYGGGSHPRIAIRKTGVEGELTIGVRLALTAEPGAAL